MTHRSNALPLILLTAAAALVILIGLAIACAPASPSAQSNTPVAPSTHTPTPTHTPAPSPTKYVREESPFNSFLAGEVAKRKARGPGFLGQSGSDAAELIEVSISTFGSQHPPEYNYPGIMRYLKEQGVTPLWTFEDPVEGLIEAELTLDMIIELSEMRGVDTIFSRGQQYPGMGPELSGVYSEYDAGLITAEGAVASLGGYPNANIPVEIWIENPADSGNTDRVLRFLKDNGVTLDPWNIYRPYLKGYITKAIPPTDAVFTSVPWSLVPRLAKLPGIEVRSNPDTGAPQGPMHSPGQQPAGVANPADAHGATAWNNNAAHGYKGDGITVGIIDRDGFRKLSKHLSSVTVEYGCYNGNQNIVFAGQDAAPGDPVPDTSAGCKNGGAHGTYIAEAVIAIAPNVKLLISNAPSDKLLSTVNWMLKRKADVIVYATSIPWDGPGDGTSPFDSSPLKAIDAAVDGTVFSSGNTPATDSDGNKIVNPAVWVNAAGNYAKLTWFSNNLSVIRSSKRIKFTDSDGCNAIDLIGGIYYHFQLRWGDVWADENNNSVGASKDLSLELVKVRDRRKGKTVMTSDLPQSGGDKHYPLESIRYTPSNNGEHCLRILYKQRTNLPSWVQLQVHVGPGELEHYTESYSIINPAESANPGMLAAGAANWATPTVLESFSSRGPAVDGRAAHKPDIVGADGGRSAAAGGPFFGTSQAAPHVAGLAALAIEMRRKTGQSDAPADIVKFLKDHALRRSASVPAGTPTPTPGPNNEWGAGFAYLPTLTPTPRPTSTPTQSQLPAKPTGLTGVGGVRSITLDWNDAARAAAYEVMQWDGNTRAWRKVPFQEGDLSYSYTITFSGSSATISGLAPGVSYAHAVRSKNGYGTSPWTSYISTTVLESTNNENIGGGAPGQGGAPESPTPTPPAPPQ